MRGKTPEETAMDLVIEDDSRVGTVYFLMNEDNVRAQIGLPWMSFGSDAESQAPEGVFLKSSTHPRAYGNFARRSANMSRDEKAAPLPDAIRRMTSFPATNLGIKDRGVAAPGYYADVVVFDPAKVQDHATFAKPQQLVDRRRRRLRQRRRRCCGTASTPAPSRAASSAGRAGPAGRAEALANRRPAQ